MTVGELQHLAESGDGEGIEEVDVITTATRAVMSGTYAVLSFPAACPGAFIRARSARLNGVLANVGPCPNERLGVLDLVVFGTGHRDARYGGGHLFRDLVEGKGVTVEIETSDGRILKDETSLARMQSARLFGSRHCFKNYSAFVNPGCQDVRTIFHAVGFPPNLAAATFSGCGRYSPLQCDPLLEGIGAGSRILMNGATGMVIGPGTRSSKQRPNLSGFADMAGMDPQLMGGFITSAGPECICSWAVAIPVVSPSILQAALTPDRDIHMPVMDVVERRPLGEADYGQVWDDVDLAVRFSPQACRGCQACQAEESCPTQAIGRDKGIRIDRSLCFNCGLCSTICPDVFAARLGSIGLAGRQVPVAMRQSDRARAQKMAADLKRRILDGSFQITPMIDAIRF